MDRERFDPDVYEFYQAALEGPGFAAPFDAADLPLLRADEISRHLKSTDPYEVFSKTDVTIEREALPPLPVRVYVPACAASSAQPVPLLLYFHGGGFIMGSIEDHDPLCGKLADACQAVVVAVEYRLAPEDPFPACIDDAICAAEWAQTHAEEYGADPQRLMAGGDSSGANISAVLALLGKAGEAPALSQLILFYGTYGCVDLEGSVSAQQFGQGEFVLPLGAMQEMMKLYVPAGTDPGDIRLNPGKAPDLSGTPPAIVVTAEFDPLRDDGEAFAKRLAESGNAVTYICMDGMMHGFMVYWQRFRKAEQLLNQIGTMVR